MMDLKKCCHGGCLHPPNEARSDGVNQSAQHLMSIEDVYDRLLPWLVSSPTT